MGAEFDDEETQEFFILAGKTARRILRETIGEN